MHGRDSHENVCCVSQWSVNLYWPASCRSARERPNSRPRSSRRRACRRARKRWRGSSIGASARLSRAMCFCSRSRATAAEPARVHPARSPPDPGRRLRTGTLAGGPARTVSAVDLDRYRTVGGDGACRPRRTAARARHVALMARRASLGRGRRSAPAVRRQHRGPAVFEPHAALASDAAFGLSRVEARAARSTDC